MEGEKLMGLFTKMFRKEDKEKGGCCCGMEVVGVPESEDAAVACDCRGTCDALEVDAVTLTVLGPGCKRCHQLHEHALAAAATASKVVSVQYVSDPAAIAEAGIMATPALLVNGKVVSQGKVLTAEEIAGLF